MIQRAKRMLSPIAGWFPVSPRGILATVALFWAFRFVALARHDRIVLAATVAGLFLLTVLTLVTCVAAIWLRFCRLTSEGNLDIASTVPTSTGLAIPYLGWIPFLDVQSAWPHHPQVKSEFSWSRGKLVETIMSFERMRASHIKRRFTVGDVFGMSRISFTRTFAQAIRVEPLPAAVNGVQAVRRIEDGDEIGHPNGKPTGDLIEMRNYQPGDPLKLVLWKHFVRTGQVLVRLPETSMATSSRLIACFIAGEGDEASAGVACSVVNAAAQSNEEITFLADGSLDATDVAPDAVEQIIGSVHSRTAGGSSVEKLRAGMHGSDAESCLLFVPSQPGPWLERVTSAVRSDKWSAEAVIGVDHVSNPSSRSLLHRFAYRNSDQQGTTIGQIRDVIQQLAEAGIQPTIYRRTTGEQVSLAALELQAS